MRASQQNGEQAGQEIEIRCANCNSSDVDTTWIVDEFKYGEGGEAVSLKAHVPLRTCHRCGFQFLDQEAEDLRQKAVCEHRSRASVRGA